MKIAVITVVVFLCTLYLGLLLIESFPLFEAFVSHLASIAVVVPFTVAVCAFARLLTLSAQRPSIETENIHDWSHEEERKMESWFELRSSWRDRLFWSIFLGLLALAIFYSAWWGIAVVAQICSIPIWAAFLIAVDEMEGRWRSRGGWR